MTNTPASTPPVVKPLLTYREAGKLLGVTERTIFRLVRDGEITNVKFGRSVRIDPDDLRRFIEKAKLLSSNNKEVANGR